MNKIKIIFISILTISCLCFLTGCYSKEEKAEIKRIENKAKENAINYIKKKYGFVPQIIETDFETEDTSPIPDFSPPPTGNAYVKMSYEEKIFYVYISGNKETTDGCDNYQMQEIVNDTQKVLEKNIPVKIDELKFDNGASTLTREDYRIKYDALIKDCYDGSEESLKSILLKSNYNGNAYVIFDNYNTKNIDESIVNNTFNNSVKFMFINCRKNSYCDIVANNNCSEIEELAIYVSDYKIGYRYVEYELNETDGLYYITMNGTYCNITKTTEIDESSKWNKYEGYTNKQIYNAYNIDTDATEMLVYVPLDALNTKKYKQRDICFATQYVFGNEVVHEFENTSYINDEFMFTKLNPLEKIIKITILGKEEVNANE